MKKIVKNIINNRIVLAENEVKDILKMYSIPTTTYQVFSPDDHIEDLEIDFPVALKVCSSKILHKTDVNGVVLNIQSMKDLKKQYIEFRKRFPTELLLIDKMVKPGVEMIVGLIQDPTFGLTLMCGIGGIFTELYQDISFRILPIDNYDAIQMIEELNGKKLLEGFRQYTAQKKPFIQLLQKVSNMGYDLKDHVDQMDLNPVFVYHDSCCVVDAKLILKKGGDK